MSTITDTTAAATQVVPRQRIRRRQRAATCRPRHWPPSPPRFPDLSVVIPTYNGLRILRACLNALARHLPGYAEVIVVDDGSADGTAEAIRRTHPWVRLIRFRQNRGFCAAVNAGIQEARGPIIETLNNDTFVTAGWADAAMKLFEDHTVASVAPRVWLLSRDDVLDSAGLVYHISGYARNRGGRRRCTAAYAKRCEIFGATASAAFYRRDALLAVGAFPEHFHAYYDDVDLAFRLRWAGYRCIYEPASQVIHWGSFSHNLRRAPVARQHALNEERTFWMNMPAHLLPLAIPIHLGYLFVRGAVATWRGIGRAYLAGKLQALRELPAILAERRRRQQPRRATALKLSVRLSAR